MDSRDLTTKQADELIRQLEPGMQLLHRIEKRMKEQLFPNDDRLCSTCKVHALRLATIYELALFELRAGDVLITRYMGYMGALYRKSILSK